MNFAWREYLSTIIDLILPLRCLVCHKTGNYLCASCLDLIPKASLEQNSQITSVFNYSDPRIRQAILTLKYRGGRIVAQDLAQVLYKHHQEQALENNKKKYLVIPIPATRWREKQRGFNQAQELTKYFAKLDPKNLELADQVLVKTRETVSQVKTKNRAGRLNNLRGAFTVREEMQAKIKNKNILLIDDVLTTGATMQEARQTLLIAGAQEVKGLTVARG